MRKHEFFEYCLNTYGTSPDYPFEEDFETAGTTLLALSKVLGCRVEDLLEYDSSEIDDSEE